MYQLSPYLRLGYDITIILLKKNKAQLNEEFIQKNYKDANRHLNTNPSKLSSKKSNYYKQLAEVI